MTSILFSLFICVLIQLTLSSPIPKFDEDSVEHIAQKISQHAGKLIMTPEELYKGYDTIFPELPAEDESLHMGNYYSYNQIVRYMEKIQREVPGTKVITVGHSTEGRRIYGMQIGTDTTKKVVVIDGGIHSREWTAVHVGYYLIERYTQNLHDPQSEVTKLLEHFNIVIIPNLNPDGYQYTRDDAEGSYKHRLWRKNRSIERCNKDGKCCKGVDLNRNWDFQFGAKGINTDPCSDIYPGPHGFSESETRTYSNWLTSLGPKLAAYFTLHSHGQLWLYPYAYAPNTYPKDIERMVFVTEKAIDAIYKYNGTQYVHGTPGDVLYQSSGSSMDWIKHNLNPDFVFALEVRPLTDSQYGFIIDRDELIPASEEVFIGVNVVLKYAIEFETKPYVETGTTPAPTITRLPMDRLLVPILPQHDQALPRQKENWETWLDTFTL